ncbi:MAG: NUDIX domain-containing protein [Chloroflexi bacterium]|nr:NUDIX domain-containing protein [Chloroflexota bacterium]
MTETACKEHKLLATVTLPADGQLLLVRYTGMPDYQRGWFLPHSFVSHLEHPDDAARRVLAAQLGVDVPVSLSYIESFKGNDGSWHLVFHYDAALTALPSITPNSDLSAAEWFALDALPARGEVSHHGWALDVAAEVLRRRGAREAVTVR